MDCFGGRPPRSLLVMDWVSFAVTSRSARRFTRDLKPPKLPMEDVQCRKRFLAFFLVSIPAPFKFGRFPNKAGGSSIEVLCLVGLSGVVLKEALDKPLQFSCGCVSLNADYDL